MNRSRSDQNDSSYFSSFSGKQSNTCNLSAIGKKCYILFCEFQGNATVHGSELLDFTL